MKPRTTPGDTMKRAARLAELRAKEKTDDGLTREEGAEFSALAIQKHTDLMNMVPLPTCCEDARTHPAVVFSVGYCGEDTHVAPGEWVVATHDKMAQVRLEENRKHYYDKPAPSAKFCPYCGKALPVMRRKDPIPATVCRVVDGGYYCSTCRERLCNCLCDPASSAFEPDPARQVAHVITINIASNGEVYGGIDGTPLAPIGTESTAESTTVDGQARSIIDQAFGHILKQHFAAVAERQHNG